MTGNKAENFLSKIYCKFGRLHSRFKMVQARLQYEILGAKAEIQRLRESIRTCQWDGRLSTNTYP